MSVRITYSKIVLSSIVWGLLLGIPSRSAGAEAFDLGKNRFLFIDDFLLEEMQGAQLTVNPPQNARLVVIADQPWEVGGITSYGNVLWDPEAELFRMYYVPICWDEPPGFCLAMATSRDGVHWDKNHLGAVQWRGSTDNNIVLWEQREGTVFIDPRADAAHRFAIISSHGTLKTRLFTSPDGVHFTVHQGLISSLHSDSQISSFWNDETEQYFHYPRRVKDGFRAVGFVAAGRIDALWPDEEQIPVVMSRDDRDPAEMDLYTNAAQKYQLAPQTYFAYPTPYYHYNRPAQRAHLNEPTLAKGGKSNDGTIETQLATSRDGRAWIRYRKPYLALDNYEGCDLKVIHMYPGTFEQDGKLVQYFAGYAFTHGDTQVRYGNGGRQLGGVFRVEQRIDGFTSLDFDYAGGEAITEPFTFAGDSLKLNINTSASGEARVAVLDDAGEEIDGFGLDDAMYINGSYLGKPVEWKTGADIGKLAGRPIRLRFVGRGTKLFSFRFSD